MTRCSFLALLALAACTDPIVIGSDRPAQDAALDAPELDRPNPRESGVDVAPPIDVPTFDVPMVDAPAIDTPMDVPSARPDVRDASVDAPETRPPCQLDPRNCGMCGRVCMGGTPACAETLPGQWGCVNNCAGFGEGCGYPGGGAVCCVRGCAAPRDTGCF